MDDQLTPSGLCLKLKELGFPQKRKYQAHYYVRPDMLICLDDLSVLKSDGYTNYDNIFATLVFKPSLQDMIDETKEFFYEMRTMDDGTYFIYTTVEEDPELIKKTGRIDLAIRARGSDVWETLVKAWIAVKERQNAVSPPRTLSEAELAGSANQEEGKEAPDAK